MIKITVTDGTNWRVVVGQHVEAGVVGVDVETDGGQLYFAVPARHAAILAEALAAAAREEAL